MIKSAEEFINLRTSSIQDEYMRAGIDEAPVEVWKDIIEKYPNMRVWVARNRSIRGEIIRLLAHDEDDLVRNAISSKYPLEDDLYTLLSKDSDEGVRNRIACNKKTPLQILREMADEDPSDNVKEIALDKYNERLSRERSK